jgi:CRISPR-associated protein Csx10
MSIRLEFDIAFKSDYHVSAGHGLGLQVDSALLRDPDNVPVIRGTVLAGLLRESLANLLSLDPFAGERRCQASGGDASKPVYCGQFATNHGSECPVCTIFGSTGRRKRWRIASARPAGLTTPQTSSREWRAGETAAQITTRVRVNPRTRRAEENKLFTREEGDGSLHFRFIAECMDESEDAWREAEWLVAAARLLRNLGAGKRRGYGECEIHLADLSQENALLQRLEQRLKNEPVAPAGAAQRANIQPLTLPADPGQHTYRLQVLVRLDEPLLVARRAEAGNQFETLETIPGAVLRGALAWRIAQHLGAQLEDHSSTAYRNFVNLFFHDTVRFSKLLPVEVQREKSGYPTIVAPRDLFTCELYRGYGAQSQDQGRAQSKEGHGVWSLLQDNAPQECPICAQPDAVSGRQAASVKLETLSGFISLVKDAPRSKHKPKQTVEMHIRIDPKSGRVRTGDLFGYVALEPGQYFLGEITCSNEQTWKTLQTMANLRPNGDVNELTLGKAGQRGYGEVSAVFRPQSTPHLHFSSVQKRVSTTERITLLLLSDAIVPDPWGRFWRGFDADWLKQELKLPKGANVAIDRNQHGELLAFSTTRAVDAFNAKLGLPRARDIAIVAGSSVCLTFTGIALRDLLSLLEAAEAQGIGLRRDEGFGRVAFNHPIYQQLDRQLLDVQTTAAELAPLALSNAHTAHFSARVLQFWLEWARKLDEEFQTELIRDGRFEAVARLLFTSQQTSLEAIKSDLQRMGRQDTLLSAPLSGRDKPNFFETDGKQGLEMIQRMLDALATLLKENELEQEAQAWCVGLRLLADRIAGPARQKAMERR